MPLFTGFLTGLQNLIFPPECWLCGIEIIPGAAPLPVCESCQFRLWVLPRERCPVCGKISLKRQPLRVQCRECESGARKFDRAVSVYLYAGTFRKLWHQVKFENHPHRIPELVNAALEHVGPEEEFNPYLFDVYTWVPTAASRKASRGFDPAEEIAKVLAAKFNRPLMQLIHRTREGRPQFELTRKERLKNVEGVFAANLPRDIRTRSALLIDDILTTGSTASACSAALKCRGIQKVVLFTLSRGA